ncbi:MAG: DNA translocase FtsK [Tannerellaceae bacterium]|jgi:S-DNA-T family DNA segregation ATPase FtsK/SpoIIIE|nr:DNA translocase FtsK [Tannerellaceae bacterium]
MAKKTVKKNANKDSSYATLKQFFTNERTRFITGLIISFLTIYIGVAFISFFFTGAADQSSIDNIPPGDLVFYKGSIENWAGVRGAYMANLFINRWFGISSFLILFFMGSWGAGLMNIAKGSILKRFLFCASWLIWGSLFFAFTFVKAYQNSFIYLGGEYGHSLSEWMMGNIGVPGTILLLLASFLILAILSSRQTLPLLNKILAIRLNKIFAIRWKKPLASSGTNNNNERKKHEREEDTPSPQPTSSQPTEPDREFIITVPPDEEPYIPTEHTPHTHYTAANTVPIPIPVIDTDTDADTVTGTVSPQADDEEAYDASDQGEYNPRLDLSGYRNPTVELLKRYDNSERHVDRDEQTTNQRRIRKTLEDFGISIASIKATVGPTITLYEVVPEAGVRIAKIRNLEDDIALNLAALGIRIIAPMPGKGTIGIEVPNKDPQVVSMQSVIGSRKFQECNYELPVALGKTITNEIFMFDLCKMPHLLVAGATGQGKSVGLNAIITSLLYKKHPSELKFVLVDPKMVEFSIYSDIERHYLAKLPDMDKPIITDFTKVIQTLNSLCKEMDDRYDLLMKAHTRNIKEYNDKFIKRRLNPYKGHKFMPYIVVIIDEFGDLIMTAGKEIELPISRIAQKARAVGIHMIIATQRPSTNIITGTIKANFPARMAFRVSSMIDSRTILDSPGANQLIGRGDLLFSQGNEMIRVQCAFVDTPEVEQISGYIGKQAGYATAFELPEYAVEGGDDKAAVDLRDRDPMFEEAARLIVREQQGSTSLIQRKLQLGYNRAGRVMDQLEAAGLVGPSEGSKARQVMVQDEYSLEQLLNNLKSR